MELLKEVRLVPCVMKEVRLAFCVGIKKPYCFKKKKKSWNCHMVTFEWYEDVLSAYIIKETFLIFLSEKERKIIMKY